MDVIYSVNGPVVKVKGTKSFSMQEMVYVGKKRLIAEVIGVASDFTTIQVYEGTTGLLPGEPVEGTGSPMSVTLAPGIITNIFDGIERPLKRLEEISGAFLSDGANVELLDTEKEYDTTLTVKAGDRIEPGMCYCTCPESAVVIHKCMLPPLSKGGEVVWTAENGMHKITDEIIKVRDDAGKETAYTMMQKWPIRVPRPCKERLPISKPLITGQRVIDTISPIAKGGTAAIPGGFGTGKTMTQHQLAKWCDADIIIYRLRRAWQRDDAGPYRVLRTYRPEDGQAADRQNYAYRQHLEYACCGKRGEHIYRYHHSRVLQRYGLSYSYNGRLYLSLG